MRVLCLGDVVGKPGVQAVRAHLPKWRKELGADLVIVNGENACMGAGNGITPDDVQMLVAGGADIITGGNHSFRQRSVYQMLDDVSYLLRPANYSDMAPGKGYTVFSAAGRRLLVVNLSGRVNMDPCACPFETCQKILERERGNYDAAIVDCHAEATSEKFALAYNFRNEVSVFFGTHTHVPTADEQVLAPGCGYITDIGMCGPARSALGVKTEVIIQKMKTGMPVRFELSENPVVLQGALFTLSERDDRCTDVRRVSLQT